MIKFDSIPAAGKPKLAFAFLMGILLATGTGAQAQTFGVVHNFTGGSDGGIPYNGFVANGKVLFGTTSVGGSSNAGVVFKVNTKGAETVLYTFTGGADGGTPWGELIRSKTGILYGTTTAGGALGLGTVFAITGKKETVLYSFGGGADGANPEAGLTLDAAGNLYGTTLQGGASGNGTVFRLSPSKTKGGAWTESVLYSFGTGTDGANPVGGVSLDSAGNLYGTTSYGGTYGYGTVFQLVAGSSWTENIIHSFQNGNDGAVPYSGLIANKSGNFYGAATEGGTNGGGTIFELTSSNGVWNFNVVYSVPGWGISGTFRNVALDAAGNIYGTTHCDGTYNAGTVYELTSSGGSWTYNQLYNFTGGTDGQYSVSNPVVIGGKIYGTTLYGGANGYGVLYEVTP
ncbi:MAG: choice-of-anchor tandem repeat GloVer-containing protein [Terriglobales bacterium]|jgi:uncharacterized repeat protein (TIGR03803 family)